MIQIMGSDKKPNFHSKMVPLGTKNVLDLDFVSSKNSSGFRRVFLYLLSLQVLDLSKWDSFCPVVGTQMSDMWSKSSSICPY